MIKKKYPELVVITDACFCEYTTHGHCGVLDADGNVDNDETLENLKKLAVSQARCGADIIAPSNMMDGYVQVMRKALDEEGFEKTAIMAYSAKFASAYYGPFRDAAGWLLAKGTGMDTRWIHVMATRLCGKYSWTLRKAQISSL